MSDIAISNFLGRITASEARESYFDEIISEDEKFTCPCGVELTCCNLTKTNVELKRNPYFRLKNNNLSHKQSCEYKDSGNRNSGAGEDGVSLIEIVKLYKRYLQDGEDRRVLFEGNKVRINGLFIDIDLLTMEQLLELEGEKIYYGRAKLIERTNNKTGKLFYYLEFKKRDYNGNLYIQGISLNKGKLKMNLTKKQWEALPNLLKKNIVVYIFFNFTFEIKNERYFNLKIYKDTKIYFDF